MDLTLFLIVCGALFAFVTYAPINHYEFVVRTVNAIVVTYTYVCVVMFMYQTTALISAHV